MTSHPTSIAFAVLLSTFSFACGGDDSDDDGATAPSTTDDDDSSGGEPMTSPTANTSDPTATPADTSTGDAGPDALSCGAVVVPAFCPDFVDRILECDPQNADLEDEAIDQCACDYAALNQTAACEAAFEAFVACTVAAPCDELNEACGDEGVAIAQACA